MEDLYYPSIRIIVAKDIRMQKTQVKMFPLQFIYRCLMSPLSTF